MTAHDTRVLAILPVGSTTITASRVPGHTGIAVIDGSTTLTVRHPGVTLAGGQVVVLGFAGIYDAETTGLFATYTGDQTPTIVQPIFPTAVGATAALEPPLVTTTTTTTTTSSSVSRETSKSKSHSHSDEHTARTTSFSSRISTATQDASSTASSVVNAVSSSASSAAAAASPTAQGSAAVRASPRCLVVAALLMSVLVGVAA